jgi:hypothetical protein
VVSELHALCNEGKVVRGAPGVTGPWYSLAAQAVAS